MSNTVAPLPSGGGVTVIAEHRSRRDGEPQHGAEDEPTDEPAAGDGDSGKPRQQREAAPPLIDEQVVPAETLFAAALLASQLPNHPRSPEEMKLHAPQGWSPPESALRLRDKLI